MLPGIEVNRIRLSAVPQPSHSHFRYIEEYLNLPYVQETLGVDPRHGNYKPINYELNQRFMDAGDPYFYAAEDHLAALLERGVSALIYVGAADWICNWVRGMTYTRNGEL